MIFHNMYVFINRIDMYIILLFNMVADVIVMVLLWQMLLDQNMV